MAISGILLSTVFEEEPARGQEAGICVEKKIFNFQNKKSFTAVMYVE